MGSSAGRSFIALKQKSQETRVHVWRHAGRAVVEDDYCCRDINTIPKYANDGWWSIYCKGRTRLAQQQGPSSRAPESRFDPHSRDIFAFKVFIFPPPVDIAVSLCTNRYLLPAVRSPSPAHVYGKIHLFMRRLQLPLTLSMIPLLHQATHNPARNLSLSNSDSVSIRQLDVGWPSPT